MGAIVGYARVSTLDQDHSIQIEVLKKVGCSKIFAEQKSGTTTEDRSALQECIDYLREGDTLVVTRIDRLARSLRDLQNIVHDLKVQGVGLKATEQPVDTSTAAGKAFLDMLGVFAEFETNLRKERQAEGIAKAKQRGVYKGRKPAVTDEMRQRIIQANASGENLTRLAKELGIGRATLYRTLKSV